MIIHSHILFNTCERLINDEAEIHHLLENVSTRYAKIKIKKIEAFKTSCEQKIILVQIDLHNESQQLSPKFFQDGLIMTNQAKIIFFVPP